LRRRLANAFWIAAIVVSHWVLDWIVHRPDLPLFPGDPGRHGLGLWNCVPASLGVEFGLFAAGIFIYLKTTRPRDRTGTYAFRALVAVLVASYLGAAFGPPPPSPEAVAWMALIGYAMVAWGWWIDRHREPARK
jgi:hypothetical protein